MIKRDAVYAAIDSILPKPLADHDPATPIREAIADSFAYVEMALELEDTFGLRLMDSELGDVVTLGDLKTAVDRCLETANA